MDCLHPLQAPLAIVTTVWAPVDAGRLYLDILDAFLLYHLALGVAVIHVYLDGSHEDQPQLAHLDVRLQQAASAGRVCLFYRSALARGTARWPDGRAVGYAHCRRFDDVGERFESDVSARQMLHAELSMASFLAVEQPHAGHRVRWVLHLDLDELLWLRSGDLRSFCAALDASGTSRVDQLTLVNYEAIATTMDERQFFHRVTHFRRHWTHVPLTSVAQQCINMWRKRTKFHQFFLFYDNGKSIVRVREDVEPESVHHWRPCSANTARSWMSWSTFVDPRRNVPRDCVVRSDSPLAQAVILHYPICGITWLRDKYERLGAFPDSWGGIPTTHDTGTPIPPCFHLQARSARHDPRLMEALYRSHVLFDLSSESCQDEWKRQLRSGVCEEIYGPSQILNELVDAPAPDQTQEKEGECHGEEKTASLANGAEANTLEKSWLIASISQQYL